MARPCLLKVWTRVSCQPEGTGGLCRWQDRHCLCEKENGGCVGVSLWESSPLPKDDFSSTTLSQAFSDKPRDLGTLPGRLVPLNLLYGNLYHLSTHSFFHPPSIHPSIHLPTHPSIHPPTYPFIHLSIHLPTHLSIHPPIHPIHHPLFHPSIHSLTPSTIHLPTNPFTHPPTHSPAPSIHPPSLLLNYLPSPLPPALPPTFPFLVVELCIQSCCPPPFLVTFELQHGTRSPVCSVVLFKTAGKGTAP